MDWEKNSFSKKLLNIFLIPIMNLLPRSFRGIVRRTDKAAEGVMKNVTLHSAIEIIYLNGDYVNHRHKITKRNFLNYLFKVIWFTTNNAKGLRNRLRLVRHAIKIEMKSLVEKGEPIKLLSIAAGSARAVIEALEELYLEGEIPVDYKIEIDFLDKNPDALTYSKDLLADSALEMKNLKVVWHAMTIGDFVEQIQANHKKFNIIEMVGLMDYFDDDKVHTTFKKLYSILDSENGMFITANIADNWERPFLTKVVGWDNMYYRDLEDFANLTVAAAPYDQKKSVALYEPMRIHGLVILRP